MAPEQAVGDPSTDYRADIYSYGCLAYELFTAHPPFHGRPTHEIIAAHVGTPPRPLRELRADVPEAVAQLVSRCLEKSPEARPQSASELVAVLDKAGTGAGAGGEARWGRRVAFGVIAAAVLIGGLTWLRRPREATSITVAVLPNVNIARDSALEVFADGLSDEVATALARVPGIQIQSRSGARRYRGQLGVDVKEAGRTLAAEYVVTGAMREVNGRWMISTELSRTSDAAELWSGTFDRRPSQQTDVAEEIAQAHAAELRRRFPGVLGVAPALAANQKTTPEAYRLYVLGQELLRRRGQSVTASIGAFRQAVALDPKYAGAHSGLSMALALAPDVQRGNPWSAVSAEVVSSARRALEFDSTLAQPHVALGLAHEHNMEWDRAETELRTALRLHADDVEARVQYGRYLVTRSRIREGLEQLQVGRRADPASALVLSHVALGHYLLGQQDSARIVSEQAIQSGAMNLTTRTFGALINLRDGRRAEAISLVSSVNAPGAPVVQFVLAAAGDTASAMARLRAVESEQPRSEFLETLRAYTMLGIRDTARALTALERATDAHEIWFMILSTTDHMWDPVRESARYKAVMRRVGLDGRVVSDRSR
jgi:serine/threonine-protein kinase